MDLSFLFDSLLPEIEKINEDILRLKKQTNKQAIVKQAIDLKSTKNNLNISKVKIKVISFHFD